jgi:Flp pilus assembly protein TadG
MASMMRRCLRRAVDDTGAELIEFAVVFPLLLLLAAGIADFGFLFARYEVLTNAAREGARVASLPGYSQADVRNRIQNYLTAGGLSATPTIAVNWAPVTLQPSGRTVNLATVVVDYPHQFSILAPVAAMVGGTGWGTLTLRSRSVFRAEGAIPAP